MLCESWFVWLRLSGGRIDTKNHTRVDVGWCVLFKKGCDGKRNGDDCLTSKMGRRRDHYGNQQLRLMSCESIQFSSAFEWSSLTTIASAFIDFFCSFSVADIVNGFKMINSLAAICVGGQLQRVACASLCHDFVCIVVDGTDVSPRSLMSRLDGSPSTENTKLPFQPASAVSQRNWFRFNGSRCTISCRKLASIQLHTQFSSPKRRLQSHCYRQKSFLFFSLIFFGENH